MYRFQPRVYAKKRARTSKANFVRVKPVEHPVLELYGALFRGESELEVVELFCPVNSNCTIMGLLLFLYLWGGMALHGRPISRTPRAPSSATCRRSRDYRA